MPWLFAETNNYEQTDGFLYDTVDSGWLTVETPTVTMPYLWWTPQATTYSAGLYWWDDIPELSGENSDYLEDLTFFKFTEYGNESEFSYLVLPKLEMNPFISLTNGTFVYSENSDPATNIGEIIEQILDPSFTIASIENSLTDELTIRDLLPITTTTTPDKPPVTPKPCIEGVSNTSDCPIADPVQSVPEYSSVLTFVFLGTAFCCGLFKQRKS
jgi:hypothetical protein